MNSDISSYVVRGFHRLEVSRTGRARARIGFLGRVILQVEERVETISQCPPPPGEKNDVEWREFCKKGETFRWRDATAFDCAGMPVLAPERSG